MENRIRNIEFGVLVSFLLGGCQLLFGVNTELWMMLTLLMTLVCPALYAPFSFLWMKFGRMLNQIATICLLLTVFYLLVTPIGFLRLLLGKDTLRLKGFGRDKEKSVFTDVNHTFEPKDFEKQF